MNDAHESNSPWQDPIVAEVRAVRAALFAAAGSDIRSFCLGLREEQGRSGHPIVTRAPDAEGPRSDRVPQGSRRAD